MGLRLHKLADKSDLSLLWKDLPGAPSGRWPLKKVEHIGEPAKEANVSQTLVLEGISEGWIEGEDHEVVTRAAGPADDKWRSTPTAPDPHIFHHFSHLTIAGVRYKVTHQPDKYAAKGDDKTKVTDEVYNSGETRVDWFYTIKKVK